MFKEFWRRSLFLGSTRIMVPNTSIRQLQDSASYREALAKLLKKLHVEFTKSRSRHSNDSALVECKNGHVIRKQFGHRAYSTTLHRRPGRMCLDKCYLNAHMQLSRPCLFPVGITECQRQRKEDISIRTDPEMMTSPSKRQASALVSFLNSYGQIRLTTNGVVCPRPWRNSGLRFGNQPVSRSSPTVMGRFTLMTDGIRDPAPTGAAFNKESRWEDITSGLGMEDPSCQISSVLTSAK